MRALVRIQSVCWKTMDIGWFVTTHHNPQCLALYIRFWLRIDYREIIRCRQRLWQWIQNVTISPIWTTRFHSYKVIRVKNQTWIEFVRWSLYFQETQTYSQCTLFPLHIMCSPSTLTFCKIPFVVGCTVHQFCSSLMCISFVDVSCFEIKIKIKK